MAQPKGTDAGRLGVGAGAAFLIATGTASTLLSKMLLNLRVPTGPEPGAKTKLFRKPWTVTLFMFLGMALMTVVAPLVHFVQDSLKARRRRRQRRQQQAAAAASTAGTAGAGDDASEPLLPLALGSAVQQQQQSYSCSDLERSEGSMSNSLLPQAAGLAALAALLLRDCGLILVPTLFDVFSTGTHKVGLMWLHVSVYQMLRASQLVFTALYSVAFLRRALTRWHCSGIGLTVLGIGLVGLAGILGHEEAAPAEVPFRLMLAGMAITVASEAFHAAQLVTEDHYLSELSLRPLTVVGLEGLLGSAVMLGFVLPLAQRLPGPAGRGLHEDSRETLAMLGASPELRLAAGAYVLAGGLFNLAGMLMTDSVGAVLRTSIEMLRTLSVWIIDLAIFYLADGEERRFGEPWTSASWLQALGFLSMVAGTLVYAHGKALQEEQQQQQQRQQQQRQQQQRQQQQQQQQLTVAAAPHVQPGGGEAGPGLPP